MQTITHKSLSSQPRDYQCPWCQKWHNHEGICDDCTMRIKISGLAKSANVVVLPAGAVFHSKTTPLIWRVLGLMQDQGAISNWIRPDSQLIAQVLGVSVQSVYRAMQRLYLLGMVERRHNPRHRPHTPADYRIALEPPQ